MMPLKYANPALIFLRGTTLFKTRRMTSIRNDLLDDIENIQTVLKRISKADSFKGLLVDFTLLPSHEMFKESHVFKKILHKYIETEKEKGVHVLGLKVPANNGEIMKIAIDCGFRHHHANADYSLLNLCLKGHQVGECSFPPFKTASAGVTAVVFDFALKNVLVVHEKTGITKAKPPTGGIDYGVNQDTPLNAVIRELKEEVNIDVKAEDAVFVGTGWSNNYRQNNPDISYIFAFRLKEMQNLSLQENEIEKAGWISLKEFAVIRDKECEKPWLLRNVVFVALKALKSQKDLWKPRTLYLTTGKPVEFYSAHLPKTITKMMNGKKHHSIDFE